ncbi:ABC transporter permease [Halomicroarcula sp. GCM10025324]|uniref:ABC transporter permease n=1 Tax=Haloarcula TaxID=2237 RepID=UPI0023E75F7C|nr:ABC transporter permease subunit [Halomicroarcula sp. ZS-22-S1]
MFEVTRYEANRRVRSTLVLAVGLGLFGLLVIGIFPSVEASGVDFEAYVESLPDAFQESFGGGSFGTIEGFLAAEFYQFVWVLLFGLYMAYTAGGTIAGNVENGRLDLLLATPISRSRVVVEKYLSLLTPIVVLNLLMPLFVYGAVILIGESISFVDLLLVHAFSIPYLLACTSIGLVLSVVLPRGDLAQRGGIAAIFLLFVFDSVTAGTDFEALGAVSPTRYYDTTEILVEQTYDIGGAVILLLAAFLLLAVARALFLRADL